jgi:hypothetical protein
VLETGDWLVCESMLACLARAVYLRSGATRV